MERLDLEEVLDVRDVVGRRSAVLWEGRISVTVGVGVGAVAVLKASLTVSAMTEGVSLDTSALTSAFIVSTTFPVFLASILNSFFFVSKDQGSFIPTRYITHVCDRTDQRSQNYGLFLSL